MSMKASDSYVSKVTVGTMIGVIGAGIASRSVFVVIVGGFFILWLIRTLVKGGSDGREGQITAERTRSIDSARCRK